MSSDASLTLRLLGDSANLRRALDGARGGVSRFVATAKADINALKGAFNSVGGRLAGLGLGLSAAQQLGAAARLDQGVMQVGQTAKATRAQMAGLRREIFEMAKTSGRDVDELKGGFDNLIASGQSWDEALATMKGVNIAMGVTKASADALTSGVGVAGTIFEFDLTKPGMALSLLDKMTVAGRQGNAELEDLSSVFSRIGPNAKLAGLSFEKTLSFVEALSLVEKAPERLATLADSTLRLFTNANYAKQAQKATGVQFFDTKGARRDVEDVLLDLRAKFAKLETDQARSKFIQKAFGTVDLDTQKGLRTLLSGSTLDKMRTFTEQINDASGTLARDLPDAIRNGVDQAGRLVAVLRKAADVAAGPLNKAFAKAVGYLIDDKKDGGKGLSGGALIAGGALATVASVLIARRGKDLVSGLLKGSGSLAAGVAQGKALEAAAGVTPVFVTNWPGGGVTGFPGSAGTRWQEHLPLPGKGAAGAGAKGLMSGLTRFGPIGLGLAAIAAVGVGAYQLDKHNPKIANAPGQTSGYGPFRYAGMQSGYDPIGDMAVGAADASESASKFENHINIMVDVDKEGRVTAETRDKGSRLKVDTMNRGRFNYSLSGEAR